MSKKSKRKPAGIKMSLMLYDLMIFVIMDLVLFVFYQGGGRLNLNGILVQSVISAFFIFGARVFGNVYKQVWRYGGIQCYIRLLLCDVVAFFGYFIVERFLPTNHIAFAKLLSFSCMNTLGALSIRMVYRFAYKCGSQDNWQGKLLRFLLRVFACGRVQTEADPNSQKIKVAIIGAGTVGVGLAEDLLSNPKSPYLPRGFVDIDVEKAERSVHGLWVMSENEETLERLKRYHIQEVIFAVPNMDSARKLELFDYYKSAGFRIKVYDYPAVDTPGQKRALREFDITDVLFRAEKDIVDEKTSDYYRDKVILITGGGGSIGSELCRQLAKMSPKQMVVLDVYENGAYDLQQELKFASKGKLEVIVEIASIRDKKALARVFQTYRPDICINAAAHKHVPFMETNCIEAVENNVFGALNVIECCEEYGCGRFMMVSTDKAVNPTNVMGATKRACEMIMQAYSTRGLVKCSATRFGNVLGSAGSVIPLFRRQISAGGPVTVTDRRIIRYFMTIPEASQLVLTSGAIANNGDLFVLDMGKPVKIWDLAVNMISMSGINGVEILETGLRPGEKLYEELLVDKEGLEKTENDLIFIEHEEPVTMEALQQKLDVLRNACNSQEDENARAALKLVVPTYRSPDEVNGTV